MADSEFQVESMGEIYAQALINEAQKQNVLAEVTEDVRGIGQLLKSNELFLRFTQAVTISEDELLSTIEKIFEGRIHPLTQQVLKSMARRHRFMFVRGLVEAVETLLRKMEGRVDVELITATELRPDSLERIKQAIGKSVGKIADVAIKIDPSLIGGMTLRVGDTLIDGSVATQLAKMEELLKRRGVSGLQDKLSSVMA